MEQANQQVSNRLSTATLRILKLLRTGVNKQTLFLAYVYLYTH